MQNKIGFHIGSPGMSTFIWGPLFWDILTDIAIRMDQSTHSSLNSSHKSCIEIWNTLRLVLPCKWCRQSYRKFIREDPPRAPYTKWIWNLRNKVNTKLEKPTFEFEKFQRRCHVYSSFSCPSTWWDIHFILALNYDPSKKRKAYTQWFRLGQVMMNYLPYKIPCFMSMMPSSVFATKFSLLLWLSQQYNLTHNTQHKLEMFVRKYSQSIAHKTPEELFNLCGPLILRCQKYDNKA